MFFYSKLIFSVSLMQKYLILSTAYINKIFKQYFIKNLLYIYYRFPVLYKTRFLENLVHFHSERGTTNTIGMLYDYTALPIMIYLVLMNYICYKNKCPRSYKYKMNYFIKMFPYKFKILLVLLYKTAYNNTQIYINQKYKKFISIRKYLLIIRDIFIKKESNSYIFIYLMGGGYLSKLFYNTDFLSIYYKFPVLYKTRIIENLLHFYSEHNMTTTIGMLSSYLLIPLILNCIHSQHILFNNTYENFYMTYYNKFKNIFYKKTEFKSYSVFYFMGLGYLSNVIYNINFLSIYYKFPVLYKTRLIENILHFYSENSTYMFIYTILDILNEYIILPCMLYTVYNNYTKNVNITYGTYIKHNIMKINLYKFNTLKPRNTTTYPGLLIFKIIYSIYFIYLYVHNNPKVVNINKYLNKFINK